MSKKTPVTYIGGISSNDFCVSCIILKSCEVQKSPGRNPDCQTVKNSFSIKYLLSIKYLFKYSGKYWEETYRMISMVFRSFL